MNFPQFEYCAHRKETNKREINPLRDAKHAGLHWSMRLSAFKSDKSLFNGNFGNPKSGW